MTPEERSALEWLERTGPYSKWQPWTQESVKERATLKSMLARPTLPDVFDHAKIEALTTITGLPRCKVELVIRLLREPSKPATKEVEVERWGVFDAAGFCSGTFSTVEGAHLHGKLAIQNGAVVIRLTGKATVKA